jgi:hypothetical protein
LHVYRRTPHFLVLFCDRIPTVSNGAIARPFLRAMASAKLRDRIAARFYLAKGRVLSLFLSFRGVCKNSPFRIYTQDNECSQLRSKVGFQDIYIISSFWEKVGSWRLCDIGEGYIRGDVSGYFLWNFRSTSPKYNAKAMTVRAVITWTLLKNSLRFIIVFFA